MFVCMHVCVDEYRLRVVLCSAREHQPPGSTSPHPQARLCRSRVQPPAGTAHHCTIARCLLARHHQTSDNFSLHHPLCLSFVVATIQLLLLGVHSARRQHAAALSKFLSGATGPWYVILESNPSTPLYHCCLLNRTRPLERARPTSFGLSASPRATSKAPWIVAAAASNSPRLKTPIVAR
jgi:hypothetical protein